MGQLSGCQPKSPFWKEILALLLISMVGTI